MQATKNPVETGGVWSIGCAGTYDTPIPSPGAGDFFDDRGKGVILFMGAMMRGEKGGCQDVRSLSGRHPYVGYPGDENEAGLGAARIRQVLTVGEIICRKRNAFRCKGGTGSLPSRSEWRAIGERVMDHDGTCAENGFAETQMADRIQQKPMQGLIGADGQSKGLIRLPFQGA